MLPELGQFALVLAVLLASAQATLPLVGAWRGNDALMAVARRAAYGQFVFIAIAFAMLTTAFVQQDFSVAYVAQNSNSVLPLIYRFTAVWGGHEGSLLLWVLILATWTIAVATFSRSLPQPMVARVLAVMGMVNVGFLLFTLLTSNPFLRHLPALAEGRDLNPLLQDPGMIIHPPMLYVGWAGFSVPFAFAIAALLTGTLDQRWVRWSRPWTNVTWGFLTLGIALGSWWAYYELGWGGWWFWDPVENASFMPWLVGTALIHSQAVTEKRGSFRGWTLLLAIAAFSLSLLGTFIVRSGVLTSVHAFASDPERGLFVLVFLALVVGGSLALYAWRAPKVAAGKPFATLSRETLILVNNLLFSVACATVLIGTLAPLLFEALGWGKISVGPPYFSLFFTLLMAPVVLLMPFGPFARWQREEASRFAPLLRIAMAAALIVAALLWLTVDGLTAKSVFGLLGAVWIVVATLQFVWRRLKNAPAGRRFTAEMTGMILAHFGLGVFVLGVLLVESIGIEKDLAMRAGQEADVRGYTFRFEGVERVQGPNFIADRATVRVLDGTREIALLHPEKRAYASGGQVMTEAAIDPALTRDLYVALGEPLGSGTDGGESWAVRMYVKPFIRCIWLGALMMMLGGFVSAADRRFRRELAADAEAGDRVDVPLGAAATANG
jgi:cytochrome c-type biogenesis protein CcmF